MGFGGIACHPRLAHDVLAGLQRGTGHLAVQVGPGADHNRVRVIGRDELTPVVVDLGNMKGLGNPPGGFPAAVTYADDLDPGDRLQSRYMPDTGVIARANDADLDGL